MRARLTLFAAPDPSGLVRPTSSPTKVAARLAERLGRPDRIVVAPSPTVQSIATLFPLPFETESALRDLDLGRWAGTSLDQIAADEAANLAVWTRDAAATPHGGESLAALADRVGAWLALQLARSGSTLAIAAPLTIRAGLAAVIGTPAAMFALDIAAGTCATLGGDGRRWTIRAIEPG